MKYGEYIRQVLSEKNIRMNELAEAINVKSRNELYRLFNNQHSYNKTKELTDRIIDAVDLSDSEKHNIYEMLKECNLRRGMIDAREMLCSFFESKPERKRTSSLRNEGVKGNIKKYRLEMYVFGIGSLDDVDELYSQAMKCPEVKIIHYVKLSGGEAEILKELLVMLRLSRFEGYEAYLVPHIDKSGWISFSLFDRKIVMRAKDQVGKEFVTLRTDVSKELYDFFSAALMGRCSHPLKEVKDKLSDYPEQLESWRMQYHHKTISVCGGMYLCRLPNEIMYRVFKAARFFGLPENSSFAQNIIKAYGERWNDELNAPNERCLIFDKEMMIEFIKNGKTIDYPTGFEPLLPEERMICIKTLKKSFESSGGKRKYRFIKGKVRIQLLYIEDEGLIISDPKLGYGKGNWYINVNTPKVRKVIGDCVSYLWDTMTYTDEESKMIMENIIKEAEEVYENNI